MGASRHSRRRWRGGWLLLAVATACAPGVSSGPRPPGAAPPATSLAAASERAAPDSILWSHLRLLTWKDFQGAPDTTSPAAAVTAYVISYEAECGAGSQSARVVTAFLPDRSWVKPSLFEQPSQAAQALRHEQTHFDLAEVHVRRARRALAQLADPCRGSQAEFDAFMQRFIDEDAETQRRYDRETTHGIDQARQADWDAQVRRDLAELRPFAR